MVSADPAPDLIQVLRDHFNKAEKEYSTGLETPCQSGTRLADLRAELARQALSGFIVPLADEHQGEYIPKRAQRLTWLTGFTGSAGIAVILRNTAAIFVDGRYILQAADQVDQSHFEIVPHAKNSPWQWVANNTDERDIVGYDPWLHTPDGVERLNTAIQESGGTLVSVTRNPIDQIWTNQPAHPLAPLQVMEQEFVGQSSIEKREKIAGMLSEVGHDAVVLTAPESIAWLINIRGGDVPYTPFCLAFGILYKDSRFELFTDKRKVPTNVANRLPEGVELLDRDSFDQRLDTLGKSAATVRLDPTSTAAAISSRLTSSGAVVQHGEDPCALPKACKNQTELDGIRAAHARDGLALTRFLAWLSRESTSGNVSEKSAADRLEAFRREGENIRGLSFPTISGTGPNGAIVHYRVTERTNRILAQDSLYLVDSGGQYLDGTTDVTRTIAIGTPTPEMTDRFTRVLKGHIALATAIFPPGTCGSQLDTLARTALWQVGLDYDHGTGHGVGHYLSVHEGPHRISKMPNRVALRPGMIISNEPGYYKTGAFGIRIENLVTVRKAALTADSNGDMLCFETLTLAPIDANLIAVDLLTNMERDWLNRYHAQVFEAHGAKLNDADREWLHSVTAPL
ncbi:MAG: X-Pro aminopeptidase [Rhodospirillaceae bacterium]|nr:X-Pro aminopeptidase [Rhodospirillaceae bacterium]